VGIGKLGNLPGGPANTAADVENLHPRLDADVGGEEVLVASNGLVKALTGRVAAKVEALAPAILVQIGRKVVVTAQKVSISNDQRTATGGLGMAYCFVSVAYSATRASRSASVSFSAVFLSKCLKYSSTASFFASLSLVSMAAKPP
jgi:hypothetical protein